MWKPAVLWLASVGAALADPSCTLTPVPETERLVMIGASTPTVLSNIVFKDRDREANAVAIKIEDGPGKLNVAIIADDDVIYDFDDPAGRIQQVFLITQERASAGVSGLPGARVRLIGNLTCPTSSLSNDVAQASLAGNKESRELLGAIFSRMPELVALRQASVVTLPSGVMETPQDANGTITYVEGRGVTTRTRIVFGPDGKAKRLPSEVFSTAEIDPEVLVELDAHAGGLRIIDPRLVVSATPVAPSERMAKLKP